jgi:hypothetical protein
MAVRRNKNRSSLVARMTAAFDKNIASKENRGISYERELFSKLKIANLIEQHILGPEYIKGQDLTIKNKKGATSGIEVKYITNAAFGSGTLKFDHTNTTNPWKLTDDSEDDSKELMKSVAKKYNLLNEVNSKWYVSNNRYEPLYLEENKKSSSRLILNIKRSDRGKTDQSRLEEFRIENISKTVIEEYYNSKGSYYIHIKEKGIYWLGRKDPFGIKDSISRFDPAKTYLRIRVQPKGRDQYRFSYELYISGLPNSLNRKGLDGDFDFLN